MQAGQAYKEVCSCPRKTCTFVLIGTHARQNACARNEGKLTHANVTREIRNHLGVTVVSSWLFREIGEFCVLNVSCMSV